jgi:GntR family transcriptional regulator
LYHQVADDLRAKIAQGVWPADARLPNERELCEMYHVSLITLRHALQILANEGLVVRNQGSGTFVRTSTLTEGLRGLSSFTEEMKALGVKAGGVVLRKGTVRASPDQASALRLPAGSDLFELYRLRTADGAPSGLQASYLSLARFPGLEQEDFEDTSLYELLEKGYGVRLFEAIETLRMGKVSSAEARLLDLKPGSAAFVVERCTFDVQGPFELVRSIMRGDRYQIRMRLTRA